MATGRLSPADDELLAFGVDALEQRRRSHTQGDDLLDYHRAGDLLTIAFHITTAVRPYSERG